MALAAGLHGAHLGQSYCRAGKVDQFGTNFKARIIVDNDVIRPFRKISGKVIIENRFQITHKELLVQFEGLCTLRYTTKLDNRTSFHQSRQCILEGTKPKNEGYQESPVQHVIVTGNNLIINPGTSTYSFTLEIPPDPQLPAPFKNHLGSLVYRLVVYMKSPNSIYTEVGEKIMRFDGHLNIIDNEDAGKPIALENFYKRSVFSRKKLVETVFSVESSGFLPDEVVPFILYVRNPRCYPLHIIVQILQEIRYDAAGKRDSVKKRTFIVVAKEREEYEPDSETTWIDGLTIPENQEPTFTAHSMYNVSYVIQYKVKILDHGTVKGEAPLIIGTCRETFQSLMNSATGLEVPFVGLRRRGSASSAHSVRSHNSATTTYSLPPAYSQLSSRIPSVETLPPAYDDVEACGGNQEITLEVPTSTPPKNNTLLEEEVDTPEEEED